MKEFWIYNALRLLLLVSSLVIVIGVWALLADEVPLLWALILAFLLSGVLSWFLLSRQREALARVLAERSAKASEKFEAYKARQDED
ncbi:DUF4229 domain-containing protein [Nocardioides jishulii]|uniref:DUF4229 domain-containing protein n=1 Tax=Nocardioides jishulii TaxID=2575440 RepID=A0A4U2YTP6_9ACTN|nr:DUF4229 domain-containing protein [Nocardioides jishulii]QCX28683.1 DUF4229 domain-containing protein [Nocardioides jishulii]TKI64424.1 DUF4229 domain-containing protein [Nocardioides jishulii]